MLCNFCSNKTSNKDGGYFNMKGDGAMLVYTKIWTKGVENVYVRSYPTNDRFCSFVIALLTLVVAIVTYMMKK